MRFAPPFSSSSLWDELFPAEQARIVELPVERVDLQPDAIDLRLRVEGLTSLCSELRGATAHQEAARPPEPACKSNNSAVPP